MRILKKIGIVFVVVCLLAAAALAVFIATFRVDRFKPGILRQAKAALGRDVNFQDAKLAFSWTQGVHLDIMGLAVAEDPAFGSGDLLDVGKVSVGVDVLGYLMRKRVDVSDIRIVSPRLSVIRQKDGSLNVTAMGQAAGQGQRAPGAQAAPGGASLAAPALLISSLTVTDGTVLYVDRSFEPPLRLEAAQVGISMGRVSLTQPFPFSVEAAVLSASRNVRAQGQAQLDLKARQVTVSGGSADLDLSAVLLENIPQAFPMAQDAVLPTRLAGKAEIRQARLTAGPQGVTDLAADIALKDGLLQLEDVAVPFRDISADASLTASRVVIRKIAASLGSGALYASGTLQDYLSDPVFDMTAGARGLKIQELLTPDRSSLRMEGEATGEMQVQGRGPGPQVFSTLAGQGKVSLLAARFKGVNVLRRVLDKIAVFPRLAQKMEESLPPRYKEKLEEPDTALSDTSLSFRVDKGRILAPDAKVGTDSFEFSGRAEAGFDTTFAVTGAFVIPPDLSAAMAAAVPELAYLQDTQGRIDFPVKVAGNAAQMSASVDGEYIAKQLVANQARVQLLKVIDKAIGRQGPAAPSAEQAASAGPDTASAGQEERVSSPAEELVGGVLDAIFKTKEEKVPDAAQ
ncbi:MAG: AsmA family protein [Deltaproteobacteria bacterium]